MESPHKTGNYPRISDVIDIKRLEHESRRFLFTGFLAAILFHIVLGVFITGKKPENKVAHQRIIELRIIEQRMTAPLTIQKRTFVKKSLHRKKYRYRRPDISMGRQDFPVMIPAPKPGLIDTGPLPQSENVRSESVEADLGVPVIPRISIPLKNRLFDDPGMYRSEIIYNPANKHAVQGYVHIPMVKVEDFEPPDKMRLAVRGLADAINNMTNIAAVVDNPLPPFNKENSQRGLSVGSLFSKRPPLVYILADKSFEMNNAEKESFKRYLMSGGILIIESGRPGNKHLRDALKIVIRHAIIGEEYEYPEPYPSFETIPPDHPIYHCFFDFEDAPPEGAGQKYGGIPYKMLPYLEGVWIDNRLIAIYSDRGYGLTWSAKSTHREQRRMGVNLIVFSLLQRMGIHRGEWYAYKNDYNPE